MRTARTALRVHLLALAIYIVLALLLTWPLAAHLGSHVPGDGADDPPLTWNLWWVRYSLLEQGTNPFDCDVLFYPLGINLAFYTLTLLNGLLSIPLQATAGLVAASNLLLLSSFVVGAYGAFLLAREQGIGERAAWPALVAGGIYAFVSSKMGYAALGQWNIASSQWIPFYVLYLFKMGERPRRWRYPLLAALFLLLQAYAELTYASFLVLFTLLWAGWQAWRELRSRQAASLLPLATRLAVVGLLFIAGLSPVLAMMIPEMQAEGNLLTEGGGFADVFSADLLGFLIPTRLHPVFGALPAEFDFHHGVGQHLYAGYALLALASLGVAAGWRRPAVRFWLLSAAVFGLLTLGPALQVNGHDTGLPLPFALVSRLPFFEGNRYPSRYSVLLFLSLAMLAGYGARTLRGAGNRVSGIGRGAIVAGSALLVALLLFEHLSIPLPMSDMRVPPIYDRIGALEGDFTLLDVPVAWRNGARVTGTLDPIIMFEQYYQSAHEKRLLAGNTSRNPPHKFQYFTEAPVIQTLIALETGHAVDPAVIESDRTLAPGVLRFFDVQVLLVHPEAGPLVVPYVESALPVTRFDGGGEVAAYRVTLPPWPTTWQIVPGAPLARLSYAEGWGPAAHGLAWATDRDARLLVPLGGGQTSMRFGAWTPPGGQQLVVEVDGWTSARLALTPGWGEYQVEVPVQQGLNEIWLHFDTLYPATEVQVSPRDVGATGVVAPVNLLVESAGQEVGNFAHIYVDGTDVSPGGRGYNVVVIHPGTGEVETAAAFDTHLDPGASQALAEFLHAVPQGYLVAVAAADEASRLLGPEAVEALHAIGAAGDLRERFRWGHATIGVQGAVPGSAPEEMGWMGPARVVVGEPVARPEVAAALGAIEFEVVDIGY
ncbi:MAG: hypothetical protein JXA93_26185 [Anaerolineae bacterium]|nr:hypothetical protein [Anaerolineae bacterium]